MFAAFVITVNRAILAGSGGTLMTTEDTGRTWKVSRLPETDWVRKSSFISEREGWVLGDLSKVFKTSDAGCTWNRLPISLSIDYSVYGLNEIEFANSQRGYLLTNPSAAWPKERQDPYPGRIYKTDDGGIHWTEMDIGLPRKYNQVVFLDSLNGLLLSQPYYSNFDFDSTMLHKTQDGGKSWTTLGGRGYGRMQFVNERCGWAGEYRTTDGGSTWFHQDVTYPILENPVTEIFFADTMVGFAISDRKILRSTDAGITWVVQAETKNGILQDIQSFNAEICYACGYGGTVLRTTDGGRHWIRHGEGVTDDLLDVDFIDEDNGWVVGRAGTILQTTDGGRLWNRQTVPPPCDSVSFAAIDFFDNLSGWVAGGEYILRSENGGRDWQISFKADLEYLGGKGRLRDILFLNAMNGFAVGQKGIFYTKGVLFETTDGGLHWREESLIDTGPLDQLSFVDENNGWICGGGVLLSTQNGGSTWLAQSFTEFLRYMQWTDRNHGWLSAIDEGALYRTTDGGVTWINVPYENRNNAFLSSFYFQSNRLGIASTFMMCDIMTTTDGGIHWLVQERLPPARLNAMTVVDDTLAWAVGTHGAIVKLQGSYFKSGDTANHSDNMLLVFPNPIKKGARIQFNLTYPQQVEVTIYDIRGSRVTSMPVYLASEGLNELQWNPVNLASGTYFVKVRSAESVKVAKCVLVK